MHLRGVLTQIPQAAAQLLAVIEAGADNDLGIDADVVRGQLGDILEHLAAAWVFHQFDPQLRIGGVDRDIDGADVHFDDTGDVLIGHIGEGDIAAEQEAHAAVVILKVEGFAHAAGQLIDEAENALIGAVVLARKFGLTEEFFYRDQQMSELSGGEKVKAQMMRLLMEDATVLLLDEPSNDIDLATLELLEKLIREWEHIVVFISHDETLIENTANMVIHIEQIVRKTKSRYTVAKLPYRTYVEEIGRASCRERV